MRSPDLAFFHSPEHGVVVRLDVQDPPEPAEVLRRHGFVHTPIKSRFHPAPGTAEADAVANAQHAISALTALGYYTVTTAGFDEAVRQSTPAARRQPLPLPSGASMAPWIDRIRQATDPDEVSDLIGHIALRDDGAFAQFHDAMEEAARWCDDHGAPAAAASLWAVVGSLSDLLTGDMAEAQRNLAPPPASPRCVAARATTTMPRPANGRIGKPTAASLAPRTGGPPSSSTTSRTR